MLGLDAEVTFEKDKNIIYATFFYPSVTKMHDNLRGKLLVRGAPEMELQVEITSVQQQNRILKSALFVCHTFSAPFAEKS
jgi:hypothetical protein